MRRVLYLLLGAVFLLSLLSSRAGAQNNALPNLIQTPADPAAYAVTYFEIAPASRSAAIAAFKQYRGASSKEAGYNPFDLLERPDWPGHFAIVERWSDVKAFEAHNASADMKRFMEALQPIRVSGYDQRPYKVFLVVPAKAAGRQAVHVVTHVDTIPTLGDPLTVLRGLAETSRKEAGNLRFDVLQNSMRLNHFTVVEVWENQKAVDAHVQAAHTKQYRDNLQPIAGGPLDERLYKAVE